MNRSVSKVFSQSFILLLIAVSFVQCRVLQSSASRQTFANPLLPGGADPWSIYKDSFYYYTHTIGDSIVLWKTRSIATLATAERKTIWVPPPNTLYSKQIWAPEVHFINNNWYVYFAADDGRNANHRLYVIENSSANPLRGSWSFKGKVADSTNRWAIDGSVFEFNKEWFMIWSGWDADKNGTQGIYIAKMTNPWTIEGRRVRISAPVYNWEKYGDLDDPENPHVDVNEGPQILKRKDNLFLIFSASGCWTDYYGLGMLTYKGKGDLLDSTSWYKTPEPVFRASVKNGVYAPGHNSFFRSPDGTEDWILYHANIAANQGCGRQRLPRAQKFTWKKDGTPNFGEPVKLGVRLRIPSERFRKRNQEKIGD
jgi:GH43 family beta-xylosidase